MEEKDKRYYVTVKGERIPVTEEVYRAFVRPLRAEQRARRRNFRCVVFSKKRGHFVRCREKCESCHRYLSGQDATGNMLSLDALSEDLADFADLFDTEAYLSEREERAERADRLRAAIGRLTSRQQDMVRMVFFEEKSQEEVAKFYGIDGSSVRHAMKRVYRALQKILGKIKKFCRRPPRFPSSCPWGK